MTIAAFAGAVNFIIKDPESRIGANSLETCQIRFESWIDTPSPDVVIVGSSMSERIPDNALAPLAINSACAGDGALTGLQVVARAANPPKLLLVEINMIERPASSELVKRLFDTTLSNLRQHVKVAQRKFLLSNLLFNLSNKLFPDAPRKVIDKDILEAVLKGNIGQLSIPIDNNLLQERLFEIYKLISTIRSRGTLVGFYEMPIHRDLALLAHPTSIRSSFREYFQEGDYCWLFPALPEGATLNDGTHLPPAQAAAVGKELVVEAQRCLLRNKPRHS